EWVHVQLHQQKGMISLSPPTICNSAETAEAPQMIDDVSNRWSRFPYRWQILSTTSPTRSKSSASRSLSAKHSNLVLLR
ncbi:hypothetical protein, partial [Enterobacter hormaechei]|uniref:hypothetical protein n=1 Tax=Enterobacter hormaechei TaxID=158836 RepID=UPI001E3EC624